VDPQNQKPLVAAMWDFKTAANLIMWGSTKSMQNFVLSCSDQSSAGAVRETVYRRQQGLPGRRSHHLEQPARQPDISPVSVNLPPEFKKFSVPCLVP